MKKWKDKLIKALGGYTVEEVLFLERPIVKQYQKTPVRIQSCYMNHLNHADSDYCDFIMERLTSELAKGILRDKLYTLNTEDTPYGTEYRMTVEIITPVDGW